jgi:hypothetical protein
MPGIIPGCWSIEYPGDMVAQAGVHAWQNREDCATLASIAPALAPRAQGKSVIPQARLAAILGLLLIAPALGQGPAGSEAEVEVTLCCDH